MIYRCSKNGCELEAQYFRNCLLSEMYFCEAHMAGQANLLNRTTFESIFVECCQETKNAILEFLEKKKSKREKLRKSVLATQNQNLDRLGDIIEKSLINLDSDLEEITGWIEKIFQLQKIAKKEEDSTLNLLALQPDIALKKLRDIIPASSEKHNSIRRLYWLNELKAKTSDIKNRFNISEFGQNFRETCTLYEKQVFVSDPLLSKIYQEYIKAYHRAKSICQVSRNSKGAYLYIYDTEEEREHKKLLNWNSSNFIIFNTIKTQLLNEELFFAQDNAYIIDKYYGVRNLPSPHYIRFYSSIYFNRSIYCSGLAVGGSYLLSRFDLDQNRWIILSFLPRRSFQSSVIFNGNILFTDDENLYVYSIEINSFSIITYKFIEASCSENPINSYSKSTKIYLIKAEERLYLIIFENLRFFLIYQSEFENEYIWNQIKSSKWDEDEYPQYCLYHKKCIFFSKSKYDLRIYYKFDLKENIFNEISSYCKLVALKKTGQRIEAIECYNQTFKFDSNIAAAYIARGRTFCDLSEIIDWIEIYNRKILKDEFSDLYDKGTYLIKLENALECFRRALKLEILTLAEEIKITYEDLGDNLKSLGRYVEATECYDQEYRDYNSFRILLKKGNTLLYDLGRTFEAIKCYDQVIKNHPDSAEAYYHKGNAFLYDLGWNLEAIKCYNKAIYYNPRYTNAYNNKGYVLNLLGRNLEAVKCYNKSIKINPKDAIIYNNKGDALRALERNQEAIECYNKAIELKPDDFFLFINRGRALSELENEIKALKDFNTSYKLMKEIIMKSCTCDSAKKKLYEWNSIFIKKDLKWDCVKLLEKLVKLQEYAVEFKEEFRNLRNVTNNSEIREEIKENEKAKYSKFIARVIEFLGSDNHEPYEEVKQKLCQLEKDAAENEKFVAARLEDLKETYKKIEKAGITERMGAENNREITAPVSKRRYILYENYADSQENRVLMSSEFTERSEYFLNESNNSSINTNHAPTLNKSNLRCFMHQAETQLDQQADMTLFCDNLASIYASIEWPKKFYKYTSKFIQFQFILNVLALILSFSVATSYITPLEAAQTVWVNLIMIIFADLNYAAESPDNKLLKEKAIKTSSLLAPYIIKNIIVQMIFQCSCLFIILFLIPVVIDISVETRFTIIFNSIAFMQIFNEINWRKIKSGEKNVFKEILNNWIFLWHIFGIVAIHIVLMQFGEKSSNTVPLTFLEYLLLMIIGIGALQIGILVTKVFPYSKFY